MTNASPEMIVPASARYAEQFANSGVPIGLLAAIQDPDAIERVLRAMNARYRARRLPFDVPELAVARAPPDGGGGWLGA